jgi:hypothetical protein
MPVAGVTVGSAAIDTGFAPTRGEGLELPPANRPIANPASKATIMTSDTTIPAVRRIAFSIREIVPPDLGDM